MFESVVTLAQANAINDHRFNRCDDGCFDMSSSHDEFEQMHEIEAEDLELAQVGSSPESSSSSSSSSPGAQNSCF